MNKIKQSFQALHHLFNRNKVLSLAVITICYAVGFYFFPVITGVVLGLDLIAIAIVMSIPPES